MSRMGNFENSVEIFRLSIFFGSFFLIAFIEFIKPFKQFKASRAQRWPSNIGITILNTALLRLLLPMTAVGFASYCQQKGWGLFNVFDGSGIFEIIGAVLLMDMVIYFQHRVFHVVPIFWRLHRVHHADIGFDITTGARFHPIEIFLSMGLKFLTILALGATPIAVIAFEVILSTCSNFNHGNFKFPDSVDRFIRFFIVTPDMHRIHHSTVVKETNSNYGFNLSIWDRVFGSYTDKAARPQKDIEIGLTEYQTGSDAYSFISLLKMPFK